MPRRAAAPKPPGPLATLSNAPPVVERTLEQSLGAQLRTLRRQAELTIAEVAGAAGISIGMLSKIETGQISPSLATLQALAGALHVPIAALFAAVEEKRDCSYVPAGQGVTIERRGSKAGHVYSLLGHALGGTVAMEPYLITLQEGAEPYIAFQHEGVEFIHMLSGEVVYRHADRRYRLRPGDSLMFDSAALHGPETLVQTPMRYLSIIVHARRSEEAVFLPGK